MNARRTLTVHTVSWDSPEAEDVRRIRFAVFVDEQRVDPANEIDAIDPVALHALVRDESGRPVATGRLFPNPGREHEGRIGRMAVLAAHRGCGAGAALMGHFLSEGRRLGFTRFVLDAQTHAIPFYAKFGFIAEGDEHLDEGIPHRMMGRPAN